MLETVHEMRE